MANLNIGASLVTVNTLAGLPVDKGTINATLSAPSIIGVASAMYQGQSMDIIVEPTKTILLPIPTTVGWYSTFGDTLLVLKGQKAIINIICNGDGKYVVSGNNDGAEKKINGYECVDLGLPSGLLWATCNVGASQPHEWGKYFQWGATVGYSGSTAGEYSFWSTCPWGQYTPPMTQLDLEHDAARANMGGEWRMPTSADTKELVAYTTTGWTYMSNSYGMKFTSKSNSNNSIFIPVAGNYNQGSNNRTGSAAYIWTSSRDSSSTNGAYGMYFESSYVQPHNSYYRYCCSSVRGVLG